MTKYGNPDRVWRHDEGDYGSKGKGSGKGSKSMLAIAIGMLAVPVTAILGVTGYILHGHGII